MKSILSSIISLLFFAFALQAAEKPWYVAIEDPGRKQMKYLKRLMLAFPYYDRVADSTLVVNNGTRYDRIIATRGNDYILAYNHTGRPMEIDLGKISGKEKNVWTMDPTDGHLIYIGKTDDKIFNYKPESGKDMVLIAVDAEREPPIPLTGEVYMLDADIRGERDLTE